jgi:hypothetical protein
MQSFGVLKQVVYIVNTVLKMPRFVSGAEWDPRAGRLYVGHQCRSEMRRQQMDSAIQIGHVTFSKCAAYRGTAG